MVETRTAPPPSPGRTLRPFTIETEPARQSGYAVDPYAVADTILRRLSAAWGVGERSVVPPYLGFENGDRQAGSSRVA
jgi:hypothetical protein